MYTIEEFDKGKTRVLKYIMYKKRSESEVRRKFQKDMDEDMLDDIIEYLKDAKYIDDEDYIKRTVNNFMILKNLSIKEIKYKLMAKGLGRNDIENYISKNEDELEEYEMKSIKNIFYKKSATMEPEDIRQYLLRKGYSSENIRKVMEEN